MKRIFLLVAGALLALSFSPVCDTFASSASSVTLAQQSEQKTRTFTGKIMKKGDNFVLADEANKTSYMLDDAKKAGQFEGKKVKVTGTVDMASNTIHVESIEEVA